MSVVVQMQMSIDGFVGSYLPESRWQLWNWGDDDWPWTADLRADFNEVFVNAGGILLSRPMVDEGYLGHWGRVAERHPADADYDFARRITQLPVFVLSAAGRPAREWPHVTVMNGALAEMVRRAAGQVRGDLLCFGGAGLVSSLLCADLVDELQLYTNPGFAGAGPGIVDPSVVTRRYTSSGATAYQCGIVVTRWRRDSLGTADECRRSRWAPRS
jgi:dihydrofolate reductase